MTEDFVILKEVDEARRVYADPEEARKEAENICAYTKRPVYLYKLIGIAKPKRVWPVQFNHVSKKKGGK